MVFLSFKNILTRKDLHYYLFNAVLVLGVLQLKLNVDSPLIGVDDLCTGIDDRWYWVSSSMTLFVIFMSLRYPLSC